jgi:hypothetical protein
MGAGDAPEGGGVESVRVRAYATCTPPPRAHVVHTASASARASTYTLSGPRACAWRQRVQQARGQQQAGVQPYRAAPAVWHWRAQRCVDGVDDDLEGLLVARHQHVDVEAAMR